MASVAVLTRAAVFAAALAATAASLAGDPRIAVYQRVEDIKTRAVTLTGEVERLLHNGESPDQLVALDERLPEGLAVVAARPAAPLSYDVRPPALFGLPSAGDGRLLSAPRLGEPSLGAWTTPTYSMLPRLGGGQTPAPDGRTEPQALLALAVGDRRMTWPLVLTVADLFVPSRAPEQCILIPDDNQEQPQSASLAIVRITRTSGRIGCHLHVYPALIAPADAAALIPEPPAAVAKLERLMAAGGNDLAATRTHLLEQWIGYGAPEKAAGLLRPTDEAGVRILIARLFEQRGQADKALKTLGPATSQAPLLAARLYHAVDTPEQALGVLGQAPPGSLEAAINGSVALQRLGKHRQACERLDNVLTGREAEGSLLESARLRSGECWLRLGEAWRAYEVLQGMSASSQLAPRAQLMIGRALSQQAFDGGYDDLRVSRPEKLREAIAIWRPLLNTEDAVGPEAAIAVANAQEALGELAVAEQSYAAAIERLRENRRALVGQRRLVRSIDFASLLGEPSPSYRRGWLRAEPKPRIPGLPLSLAGAMAESRYQQLLNDYRDLADLQSHLAHQRHRLQTGSIVSSAAEDLMGKIKALQGSVDATAERVEHLAREYLLAALEQRQNVIEQLLSQAHLGLARTTEHRYRGPSRP